MKKKLDDIHVSSSDLLRLFGSTISPRRDGWKFENMLKIPLNWEKGVIATTIAATCERGDAPTIIDSFSFLLIYPDATKMLWHYFTGNGDDVEVPTDRLFNSDRKLRISTYKLIAEKLKLHQLEGSVEATQYDYGNLNWHYALGRINVDWKKLGDVVELSIRDKYAFSPTESRVDQCVHEVMDRAIKYYSAKPFEVYGTVYIVEYVNLIMEAGLENPSLPAWIKKS